MKLASSLIAILIVFFGYSQRSEDDLLNSLETSSGEDKVHIYYDLSMIASSFDLQRARGYVDKGVALSNDLGYQLGITKGTLYYARIDVAEQNHELGIDRFLQVMHSGENLSKQDSIELLAGMGSALSDLGAYELAIDFRKKLLKNRQLKTGPDVYYPLDNIAYAFLQLEQYDSANYYYNRASEIAEEMGDPTTLMHCYNNVGYGYFEQGNPKTALEIYRHGLETFEQNVIPNSRDSILYGMLLRNSAMAVVDLEGYAPGLDYLDLSTDVFNNIKDSSFLPRNHVISAKFQLELGKLADAKRSLDLIVDRLVNIEDKLGYYRTLSTYYTANGQDGLALEAYKEYIVLKDQFSDRQAINSTISDVIQFQTDRIKNELALQQELRENEGEISTLKIRLIIGGSGMLIIILLVLFLKYTSGRKKKEQLLKTESLLSEERLKTKEVERKRLEQELNYKNKDLTDFAIDITRKHDFIQEMLAKLNNLKKSTGNDSEELKETIQFVKAELSIDENLKIFQDNIDQINHEFMDKLESLYPDLTKSEKQLCALLRLQLTTKEIATIKNISADSVKTLRHRLRKKLRLSPEDDLGEFFKSLG